MKELKVHVVDSAILLQATVNVSATSDSHATTLASSYCLVVKA